MFLVGLTGGIAMGKSTVSKMFSELDVPIIDADIIARQVVEPGKTAWKKIRQHFGPEVFESDGQLNRKKLADIIFQDPQKRKQLNKITHPQVAKEIIWKILTFLIQGHQFVIIDTPLLFEANTWLRLVHKVIVVKCSDDLQLERLMKRNAFTESEAKSRIACQISISEKCKRANFVIENSLQLKNTEEQVLKIFSELRKSRAHWKIRIVLGIIITSAGYAFLQVLFKVC